MADPGVTPKAKSQRKREAAEPGSSDAGAAPRSKSQQKRKARALHALGESLATLVPSDLARIPMWPDLEAAVAGARGLERAALRRQIRYIARLLRQGDAEPIALALDTVRRPGRREAARHRRLERLCDALIHGDEALERVRETDPDLDFRKLRRLAAAVRREREEGAPGNAGARRLFRFLRDSGLESRAPGLAQLGAGVPRGSLAEGPPAGRSVRTRPRRRSRDLSTSNRAVPEPFRSRPRP